MELNREIFREYDIRGIVDRDLDHAVAGRIGRAFARYLESRGVEKKVLIGRDNRVTSPLYSRALGQGLAREGVSVTFLGEVPTPVFYHAAHTGNFPAGVMVTASHNPPEYNGFKLIMEQKSVFGREIQALYRLAAEVPETGAGDDAEPDESAGPVAVKAYIADLVEKTGKLKRPVKVVLDCGNGVAGPVALPLLEALGAEVIPLYCESDPSFPNHQPDPVVPENMRDLVAEARKTGAELGIGIDGDGDRIGLCDERGGLAWGDTILALLAGEVLAAQPGATIVFDVKCSQALADEIKRLGGKPLMWKTGHSLIEEKMREAGAPAAGELSGHLYLADRWYGFDDALYASARVIALMSEAGKPLSGLIADLPQYVSSPEIRVEVAESEKFGLVEKLKAVISAEGEEISDIDGVKVFYPDGWGLVRASNTQPALVMRFEAGTRERAAAMEAAMRARLDKLRRE